MVELLNPKQSKAKFFLLFLRSLVEPSGAPSTRDRVGEPYAMPIWVILTYVIVCSFNLGKGCRILYIILYILLFSGSMALLNVSIEIYLRLRDEISMTPYETPKKSPDRPKILTKTL